MASILRSARRAQPTLSRSIASSTSRVASVATRRHYATEQSYFPDEPAGPIVKTAIPGPESQKAIERLSKVFDTRSLNMMTNYQQSFGN